MQTGWLLPDKKIWIKQEDVFVPAVVQTRSDATKKIQAIIENTNQKVIQSFNKCYQRSPVFVEYQDMCNMNILNEPEILYNLKKRYAINKIYTKIGPTLIALNPYKIIQSLYDKQILMSLREKVKNGAITDDLNPHAYLTAGGAYQGLKKEGKKQAIVISGQSGAGKTQNTKYCMKFLTSLSHIHHHNQKQKAIQDIILECNPILESFGNSKTVRNSNSSRFGKYVRLFISKSEQMTGARIQNYLLQKSRVTSVSKKQRSFHIFYYLINSAERQAAGLLPNQKYNYLQSSGCLTAQGIDDKSSFRILKSSLQDLGFTKENTMHIWLILGSILLLGNLQFDNKDNLVNQNNLCKYDDPKLPQRICKNLGLKINELNDLLLEQKLMIGKQVMVKKFDKNQCITNKNTLAKALYGRMFDHLVQKINDRLWINKKDDRSISILDIFGFEIFDKNSFQQLCINFTNERLQQLYTKYVFENQIVQLKKDGLGDKIKDLTPPDNKPIIELIQKRMGISVFSLIDQKTALGSAKDEDIVVQLRKMKHKSLYVDPQPNKTTFMILHTQNPVIYSIQGFKYKNQDSITQQIDSLLNKLFPTSQAQQFKGKTLVTKFDKQLRSLNQELESSELHFIRCIKPNQTKQPDHLDEKFVLQQVKYLGILETIQIRKSAFPFRTPFHSFVESHKDQIPLDKAFGKLSPPQQSMYILKKLFPGIQKDKNSYLLGKQRLYLKEEMQAKLNQITLQNFQKRNKLASKIQKQYLQYKNRGVLLKGLKKYLKKMKVLKKIMNLQIFKIKIRYFQKYRKQVQYATKQLKQRRQKQKRKDIQNKKKEEELKATKQANQRANKFVQKITKIQPILLKYQKYLCLMKITEYLFPEQAYQTTKYTTSYPSTVASNPPQSQTKAQSPKKSEPEVKSTFLSQSYMNHQSVLSEDRNVLIKGELRIPMYQRNEERMKRLNRIITHSFSENQKQNEADPSYNISASVDDKFTISPISLKGELGHRIVNFDYMAFFEQTLRKRKTLFGRNKGIAETLTAKDVPISKSLLLLSQHQQVKAVEVFKLLLWISDSHKTQKIYQPIQKLLELMQGTSPQLRNQVFVQIMKQQNVKNQYASIKMYQIMAIYIHVFRIDESFIMAYLSCLLERNEDPNTMEKIRQFINYIFPRALRHITLKEVPIHYQPIQFQLAALMCKRQVPVSVFFSIGNSIIIKVESYEVLGDLKERIMDISGINRKRIVPDIFGFFEVMSFQNQQLEQIPLDDNKSVWDLLTYWQKAKGKFEQTNIRPPDFGLYFKIKYAYQLTFDDQQSVQLFYAQTYFDLFLGRLKLSLPKLLQCSAMMKSSQPNLDIDFIIPLWAVQDNKAKMQYLDTVVKLSKRYQNMSRHEIRFQFIRNCTQSPLCMAIAFPTEGSNKFYMKPKRIYILQNQKVTQQIGIRKVLRWGSDDTTLMLTIKDSSSQRVMTVKSHFAKIISSFLSSSMKLVMHFR